MSLSTSIEQQHQEFKRQISTHDTYPCFLLDQTFQQRVISPTANAMSSYLSAQAFSPLAKSPIPTITTNTNNRLSTKQANQYRLFPSSPSNNLNTNRATIRSTTQIVDVPIEKTIVPLRTMTDLFPSFSYANMKIPNKKSSNHLINTTHSMPTSMTGVSVFGFHQDDIDLIIRQFEDIGQIIKIERPTDYENRNFLNIIYNNHVSYQNAVNRDGLVFNGYIIGVVPLVNK